MDISEEALEFSSNGRYAIAHLFLNEGRFLLETKIPRDSFFQFTRHQFITFFNDFSHVVPNWQNLEIVQFQFETVPDCDYFYCSCVIKTFYIKIIQRKWKAILKKRKTTFYLPHIFKRQAGLINAYNKIFR